MATIFYDEFGVTYDSPLYAWDGSDQTPVPPTEETSRPIYWRGFGGNTQSREEAIRKKKRVFTSLAVKAEVLSINGYDVDLSVLGSPNEILFAGEDDETQVTVFGPSIEVIPDPWEVESTTVLLNHPIDAVVVASPSDMATYIEPEAEPYEGDYEDLEVLGRVIEEETQGLSVEAKILTETRDVLTLSCQALIKSDDTPIITLEAVLHVERDEQQDSEDEG